MWIISVHFLGRNTISSLKNGSPHSKYYKIEVLYILCVYMNILLQHMFHLYSKYLYNSHDIIYIKSQQGKEERDLFLLLVIIL